MTDRILILGGDGYLGWPTAMALSRAGHRVAVVDNFAKRQWELELGVRPLFPIPTLHERIRAWREVTEHEIELFVGDLTDYAFVESVIGDFRPDTIVHYGEQPSAPYSMIDVRHATYTQANNVIGNLNVMFAIRDIDPETHLVKLGTMGEYGTPDIDIEEGYLTVDHNGRQHTFLYPKTPGSMYHLSQGPRQPQHPLRDCRIWGLRATDLNQGVVYGVETDESALDPRLATSFHYDEVFGTALNRFCVQAVDRPPAHGLRQGRPDPRLPQHPRHGRVRRAWRPRTRPTRASCASTTSSPSSSASSSSPSASSTAAEHLGWTVTIEHTANPRKELEEHYYNARHTKLLDLGLQPRLLNEELIDTMLAQDQGPRATGSTRPRSSRTSAGSRSRRASRSASDAADAARDANGPHHRRAPGSSAPTWPGWLAARGDRVRILDDLSIGQPRLPRRRRPTTCVRGSLADRDGGRAAPSTASTPSSTSRRGPGSTTPSRDPLGTFEANVAWSRRRCSRRPGWRACGGSCSPRRTPPPATTSRRATRPTCPTRSRRTARPSSRSRRTARPTPRRTAWPPARCASRTPTARTRSTSRASSPPGCGRRSPASRSTINGDGEQTRDFVYVDDLAAAIAAALDAPEDGVAGELFQAGTGVETTVDEPRRGDRPGRRAARSRSVHGPARAGDVRRNVAGVDKAARRPRLPGGGRASTTASRGPPPGSRPRSRIQRWPAIEPHAASGSE